MDLLAIDPGTTESGWVSVYSDGGIITSAVTSNEHLLILLADWDGDVAVEMIASYGMPVGREVFDTCRWIGRFQQMCEGTANSFRLIYRQEVKLHLCGSSKARDGNIRQALIDLLGPPGTKRAPGPTYGVKSHAWAALGVAATALNLAERVQ